MTDGLPRLEYRPGHAGPLAGIRVLDLSRLVAGNMATHLLADFGAEVVKVEDPNTGDSLRRWQVEGVSTYWSVYARNKKSLGLDIRSDAGRTLLLRLVPSAQVLVESFVPGKLEELGLSPSRLLETNPKLVILRISGFGQTGPASRKPGFGTLVEASAGFAFQNGYPDRPPLLSPVPLSDMFAGLYGATAVMIALREVEVGGGGGQVVDVSLLEAMIGAMGPQTADLAISRRVPSRQGSRVNTTAPRNVYRCADGAFVALSAATQPTSERLFRAIGRPDLIADARFADNASRVRNADELDALIAGFLGRNSREDAIALLQAAGVPVAPVQSAADLAADPHVRARAVLACLPDPVAGELPMHNITPRLSRTPGAFRSPAPVLGEHTDRLLEELGLSDVELLSLHSEGVVSAPPSSNIAPGAPATS